MKMFVDKSVLEQALEALEIGWSTTHTGKDARELGMKAIAALSAALAQPVQEPVSKMTTHRAIYFMERFKREEKLLGPNEQAALDFVISMLEKQAEPVQEHEDWCASVTQLLLSYPPQKAPCNCKPRWVESAQEPVKFWPLAPKSGYYDVNGKRMWLEKDDPFPEPTRAVQRKNDVKD